MQVLIAIRKPAVEAISHAEPANWDVRWTAFLEARTVADGLGSTDMSNVFIITSCRVPAEKLLAAQKSR
jgi:hypothetical protein